MLVLFLALLIGCQPNDPGPPPDFFKRPTNPAPPIEPAPSPGFVTTSRLESAMQVDLNAIASRQEKLRTRYLVGCDRANQGLPVDEFEMGVIADFLAIWFDNNTNFSVYDHDAGTAVEIGQAQTIATVVDSFRNDGDGQEQTSYQVMCNTMLEYYA